MKQNSVRTYLLYNKPKEKGTRRKQKPTQTKKKHVKKVIKYQTKKKIISMYLKFNRIRESCSYYYVYETKQTTRSNFSARQNERKNDRERVSGNE